MANDTTLSVYLYEIMGAEAFLSELIQALSQDEYDECMEYIARMNDIDPPTEEEMEGTARMCGGYKDAEQTSEWAESQNL